MVTNRPIEKVAWEFITQNFSYVEMLMMSSTIVIHYESRGHC